FRAGLQSVSSLPGAKSDWLTRWDELSARWVQLPRSEEPGRANARALQSLVEEVWIWLLNPDNTNSLRELRDSTRLLVDWTTRSDQREWWKRIGRLKPIDIADHIDAVEQKYGFEAGYREGLNDIRSALLLYRDSHQNLLMVASDAPDKPWSHLSSLPADHPASKAALALGEAWRAGDAAKANAAIATLATELPKVNGQFYPTSRRSLEAAYNRMNWFEWGFWLYAFALLGLLLAFGTGRRWLAITGGVFLFSALAMHGAGFVSRCLIAERFAIQNQFESMTGLSLFATLVGCILMLVRRQWLFGAAAAGVGFMVLITATQAGIPGVKVEREAAILNTSVLLKYHVTTVLVSYGLIALGFMVSLFYLGSHYAARARGGRVSLAGAGAGGDAALVDVSAAALGIDDERSAKSGGTQRVLHDLDKAQMIVLQLAFWTLGVGILLGAWWADHSWGRWWAFDPKELWALVTWIVYLVVIHVRFTGLKDRGLTTAWLSVLGFVVMLWTYFGVNLLLPGLHAYA
ncbi:MAG: cytochrome c biogenesis protein, partial [Phycisphaerales bacterium]|nr:cytochrome c biogenesis protein [Phycisphaerales bacterium]